MNTEVMPGLHSASQQEIPTKKRFVIVFCLFIGNVVRLSTHS